MPNNTGYRNTGNRNTGNRNTGYRNTGDRNTGNRNTGNRNTGNLNTGNGNTGNRNTGNLNTGNGNTGNGNTGNRNTGSCNTGDRNTGNRNAGYLNTISPKTAYIFNKEVEVRDSYGNLNVSFPDYFYYDVETTQWIRECDMSDEEKKSNPTYKNTGWYLKIVEHSWDHRYWRKKSFEKASHEDIMKTFDIPNFDPDLFEEISGISLHNYKKEWDNKETVEVTLEDIAKKLGIDVNQLRIKE